MIYKREEDPSASTIDTDLYIQGEDSELKRYVEDRQIMKILDMEIRQAMMESELQFNSRIDTITHQEIQQLIDNELEHVDRLIYEKTAWSMGMCILDDKDKFI